MDPILLIIAMCLWTTHLVQEAPYAIRGKTSPRMQLRLARMNGRANRPGWEGTGRHAGRAFWANLWHDSWDSAHERRTAIRSRRAERIAAGTHWRQKAAASARRNGRALARRVSVGVKKRQGEQAETAITASAAPICTDAPPHHAERGEQDPPADISDDQQPDADDPVGAVIETERNTETMSTPHVTGETTDINQAVTFAQGMRESAERVSAEIETSMAALQAAEVSGRPIELLGNAQDLAASLAGVFGELQGELMRHLAIGEAYAAVGNDAGSKEFNTLS